MLRMGGQDAAFLYGETPSWHMHVACLMILDPTEADDFSFEGLRQVTIDRLPALPQFRWKVVDVPFGLDRPGWVEETHFDPDFHIRRIAVPPAGGAAEVGDLVGRLASYQIDRRRPLWEMWVIEGLADGKVAVLFKIHHSIIDGSTGTGIAEIMLDTTPDPPRLLHDLARSLADRPIPGVPEMLVKGLWNTFVATPVRVAQFAGQTLRQGIAALGVVRHSPMPSAPYSAPRTSLNGPLTPRRSFASARVDIERVRAIRRKHDVKLNDVVLALCAGALREHLAARGDLPRAPLIAQCPVSLRTEEDHDVGNKVGSMFASLATDIDDPVLRLQAIHQSTMSAKEMQHALAVHRIMGLTDATPPALIGLAARTYSAAGLDRAAPPPVNLVISNVPGPSVPLFMAGAKLEAMYPMGPLLFDMGLNITVLSYCEHIDFGFQACPDLVADPQVLADRIEVALDELESA